ncbi:glycerol-3-phosphate dehydrogenase [Alkalilimnicola ehrlichii]|uniref:Glycerol-3-phosphate dehydrogenase [NAD(P)+] n=1 Tax=Alkalilimnicola ehrlichii TaxID=351052 RepID=A0A3E0X197_9GAMM|nr:NAD(P)H-dependent glycerol-3-phosphate dehydrogenase [Alkalilimnicola ehrlichii]RFA30668.1 glycerol-3-phosphate dehydrogenase [Alkalilimnicola ehrlichii]RFA38247.1 glycerol-3-phosphate dehydrogenase [Alkalilimnicola ehrlichii]
MSGTIAVLGAGSWGTALALALARNGRDVRLWGHSPEHTAQLAADRENRKHLPGTRFPNTLIPEADLHQAVAAAADILIVVPSHGFRDLLERLAPILKPSQRLAWATKGLDARSGQLLHEVADELVGPNRPLAVLSGPSFAKEVAQGLPTAVTIAATDDSFGKDFARAFHSESFRVYTSRDITGVELGGAVKNVLAVAAGVSDGLGFGANARAGLITRGLAEMMRLSQALKADPQTIMGLSGVGDLILTCTDDQSRNRRFGLALGQGNSIDEAVANIGQTVEAVRTAREVYKLAQRISLDMPICEQVYYLVTGEVDAETAVRNLMARAQKAEF